MIDERKGVRLADLSLKCEQKTQHQLGAETHRSADVADDDELWLANAVAMFDLHRHAVIFKVGVYRCFRVELSVLGALFVAVRCACGVPRPAASLRVEEVFYRHRLTC